VQPAEEKVIRIPKREHAHTNRHPEGSDRDSGPAARKLGFDRKTKVVIVEADDGVAVQPLADLYIERVAGVLSGGGKATQAFLDERQTEKAREDDRPR
jgi:hypothetical protein